MERWAQSQIKQTMDKVLEVRYSDLEQEHALCLDLLKQGGYQKDSYVTAFAHTYLGDYFIGTGEISQCFPQLAQARDLALDGEYGDLLTRIYSLLGLYYEMAADEQSSLQYYMEGIEAARKTGDKASEGLILNNIAGGFQHHHGYEQALQFYEEAYELIRQTNNDNSKTDCIALNNLATVSILLGRLEKVEFYIRQCEKRSGGSELVQILCAQSWCQYYAAIGDAVQAENQVRYILSREEKISANKFYAFGIYTALFDSMKQLGNAPFALHFLMLMEACCADSSADQLRQLEDSRITYCLEYETDEEKRAAAYFRYCQRTIELTKMGNQAIANGLKTTIQLFQVARQKEALSAEHSDLKSQVNLDDLTQVYTRRYLEELIRQQEHTPSANSLGFIMMDVDCLKEYNDTYGHLEGDKVLRTVGMCLRTYAGDSIYPCRFGGDEFVCLCIGLTDGEIRDYLNKVRDELLKKDIPHCTSRCAQRVTLSIGFSNETVSPNLPVRMLLERADKALYRSKLNGRNTYSKHGQ